MVWGIRHRLPALLEMPFGASCPDQEAWRYGIKAVPFRSRASLTELRVPADAFGRILSGTVKPGDRVRVLGEAYTPEDEEDSAVAEVSNVWVYQARYRIPLTKALAGALDPSDPAILTFALLHIKGNTKPDWLPWKRLARTHGAFC